ncbi:hypothetical protein JW707_03750 [Candidatus Woesearchaeota archaeon]|nr:hypothetical protein [Candidatus Woesearchaeota archaeon]
MRKKKDITKSQVFISLFLLSLIILLAPHIIRAFKHGPMLIGEEPYYHARISRQISEEGIPREDTYIYGGRPYSFNPYHFILAPVSMIAGVIIASKAVPFACGILSVLVFYFILKNIGFDKLNRIMITIVFLFSPVFIYTFSFSTPFCALILLDLLGFYLFMQKEKKLFMLSIVTLIAASFFSVSNLIIILILTLAYTLAFDKKKNRFKTLALLVGTVFFFYYVPLYFKLGFLSSFRITTEGLLQRFVTDLGGFLGFSIFALLLSILGFVIAWGNKKRFYKIYLIMIAVILYSFFYNYAVIYSNFIISILSGIALSSLVKRKWSINIIRNLSILLLFCSLLFSAVSYTVRISDQQPSAELMDALDWIKDNSDKVDIVFSHYANGFWIEFEAERPAVLDSLADTSLEHKTRLEDSSKIFSSWDIEQTRSMLTKYNVSFVLITSDMSDGLVWDQPDQGLAYLVRNSETFKKEYNNDHAGVWRYIYNKNG